MYFVHISNQHTTSLGTLFYQGSKACISSKKKKDNRNSLWSLKAITALILCGQWYWYCRRNEGWGL